PPACSNWWRSSKASSACAWRTQRSCRRISIRFAPSCATWKPRTRSRRNNAPTLPLPRKRGRDSERPSNMRIEEFLRDSARRCGDKIALVAGDARVSYRELDLASDRLAGALAEHGIARGDRVIVFMDNCHEAVIAIFAALKAGAVFSPINPSTKAEKLAYVINNCGARALITQEKLSTVASAALADAPSIALTVVAGAPEPSLPGAARFEAALAADVAPPDNSGI